MRQPKIDRRRRYAEWVAACPERADLWKASPDAKWYLMREWSHQKPPIGHQEFGDRLKVSRQCVQLQLQYALPPSERVSDVVPPLLNIARQLPTSIMERVLQERYEEAAEEWQEEDCRVSAA